MLHVTTEIGKPGKKERERRHFPEKHNVRSEPTYKARGRRYIAHNYGTDMDWVPHGQYIEPQLTEAGPDWSSRLRYIKDPDNPDYPAAEIWPNNWRSMRPYPYARDTDDLEEAFGRYLKMKQHREKGQPDSRPERPLLGDRGRRQFYLTYKRSENEWLLDPGLSTSQTATGLRCYFEGRHKSSATSDSELTHTMLYGRGRPGWMIDIRNGFAEASPGDKSYQVPEYSPSFHKQGSTRPLHRYGESYRKKSARQHHQQEVDEVKRLEMWKPATPLPQTLPVIDK